PMTRGQVPRGARPDAVAQDRHVLIKHVTRLRCTYQIRVLTAAAARSGRRLVVVVPTGARLSPDLAAFVREHRPSIVIERRPA
ncbi:hypothetical protein, partial [Burkholderia cenocepacia]|uniref:hypothetical protein n=1 Tax=Burkholderia cenocepacia TaxID=95486 RepID=UPI0038CC0590